MASQAARKDSSRPDAAPAAVVEPPRPARATPLDPLIAVLTQAVARSGPGRTAGKPPTTEG